MQRRVKVVFRYGAIIFIWLLICSYRLSRTPGLPILWGPIPVPEEYPHVPGNTTVVIKTMGRRHKVAFLVYSIETLYPKRFKILIGDDGKQDESDLYQNEGILEEKRIRYFWFGFDIGVSAGRNRLASLCDTKYVINMDDDMYWTKNTNIYELFKVYEETKADIITMSLIKDWEREHYQGDVYIDNGTKTFCLHEYPAPFVTDSCNEDQQRTHYVVHFIKQLLYGQNTFEGHRRTPLNAREQCYETDIGYTMYFSTRQFLLANPWKGLIGAEHNNWFWGLKHRTNPAKVVACLNIVVVHNYQGTFWKGYKELRRRAWMYNLTSEWNYERERSKKCCELAKQRKLNQIT